MNLGTMKRIEFAMTGQEGKSLSEPGFVENCSELPIALMRAMKDFLKANEGLSELPLAIRMQPSPNSSTR